MAKRKKRSSKVQKRKGATARPEAKKLSKAARGKAVAKPAVARAKPKRAPVKKAARKERMKQPVAPAVETVTVEHPAPEFEEVSQVSPGPDEPEEWGKSGRYAAKKRTKARATVTAVAKTASPARAASTIASRRSRVACGNPTQWPGPELN
jgi:hypothetical protein